MNKYDSFLYGNGLTLSVLSTIRKFTDNKFKDYLFSNVFLHDFIVAKPHSRILREYLKYFSITEKTKASHDKARSILYNNIDEISNLGFERWVSRHLFDDDKDFHRFKQYVYLLYNYWYHSINKDFLNSLKIKRLRNKIGKYILQHFNNRNNIYTINFDNVLDESLHPKHLHGSFHLPLDKIENIILSHYNEKEFEYKYLFGTNGLEKLSRLNAINKLSQNSYNLDFFFDNSLVLGSLLIFGISFGKVEFMSDEFLSEFPQHKTNNLFKTVDGHVLLKLEIQHQKSQLSKITIAYFSDSDKKHYINLFLDSELKDIIEYKHCDEVFNLNIAL